MFWALLCLFCFSGGGGGSLSSKQQTVEWRRRKWYTGSRSILVYDSQPQLTEGSDLSSTGQCALSCFILFYFISLNNRPATFNFVAFCLLSWTAARRCSFVGVCCYCECWRVHFLHDKKNPSWAAGSFLFLFCFVQTPPLPLVYSSRCHGFHGRRGG